MALPFAWRLSLATHNYHPGDCKIGLMPTRTPVRPTVILVICFAVAIALPVVYITILQLRLRQAHLSYGTALLSQPVFLGILVCGASIAVLIAFPIIWFLRLRLPLFCWIIDGLLLAASFILSSRAMEFDLYFHDVYVVVSIRHLILWVWTTLTIPLLWLTIRFR